MICGLLSASGTGIDVNGYSPGKGEKLTVVEYEMDPFVITGWVKKKAFVDGSPIEIRRVKSRGFGNKYEEVVMSGIFRMTDGNPTVDGEAKCCLFDGYKNFNNGTITGVFGVSNMPDGSLSAKKKLKLPMGYRQFGSAFKFKLNYAEEVRAKIERYYPKIIGWQKPEFVQKALSDGAGYEQWLEGVNFKDKPVLSVRRMVNDTVPATRLPEDNWRIEYSDGDVYNGSLSGQGEMRLSTGETIKEFIDGLITGECDYTQCYWIVFSDGEEMKSLEEYWWSTLSKTLSKEEKRKLVSEAKSPTELRDKARRLINLKQAEKEREQAQAEREKRLKEERAAAKYISLYGEKYGRAVYEKRVVEGMTRKMVTEFLPPQYYVVTKKGPNELWVFSERKVEAILRSTPDGIQAMLVARMFGGSVGKLLRTGAVMGIADIPLSIKFQNGRVVSITR